MHCTIDMSHAVPSALRAFAPLYVETVERWRKACADICAGREPEEIPITGAGAPPTQGAGGAPKLGEEPGLKI